ncbi:TPA: hypothetical protein N0F65_011329 [Lagenidium giganteum]|uniref:Uncharacterized protein n=1 Tax=Lagenidium giganteum TaxID=4803 RepID=A0AAV2YLE2_9STRA|nr:TPA: hypothetical protein N0F65_011329 [Lagenidium giganteum]
MYIGPWQEYRLAKIQDDAIQSLKQEWEDQLRVQVPDADEDRLRELMQPLMAKLPSLLLAAKFKPDLKASTMLSRSNLAKRNSTGSSARPSRPSSSSSLASLASSTATRTCKALREDVENNQETHDDAASVGRSNSSASVKRTVKKKPKKPPPAKQSTALQEVEKRKKMFATWLKAAAEPSTTEADGTTHNHRTDAHEAVVAAEPASGTLPPLLPHRPHHVGSADVHVSAVGGLATSITAPIVLPPIHPQQRHHQSRSTEHDPEWDFLRPYAPATTVASVESDTTVPQTDADDSFDEDDVNDLLKWTDTLLSPAAFFDDQGGGDPDLDGPGIE